MYDARRMSAGAGRSPREAGAACRRAGLAEANERDQRDAPVCPAGARFPGGRHRLRARLCAGAPGWRRRARDLRERADPRAVSRRRLPARRQRPAARRRRARRPRRGRAGDPVRPGRARRLEPLDHREPGGRDAAVPGSRLRRHHPAPGRLVRSHRRRADASPAPRAQVARRPALLLGRRRLHHRPRPRSGGRRRSAQRLRPRHRRRDTGRQYGHPAAGPPGAVSEAGAGAPGHPSPAPVPGQGPAPRRGVARARRHRPLQVRLLAQGRGAGARAQPRLLGRKGAPRPDPLPLHSRQRGRLRALPSRRDRRPVAGAGHPLRRGPQRPASSPATASWSGRRAPTSSSYGTRRAATSPTCACAAR